MRHSSVTAPRYDVVIIGGGPAGITAAVELARKKRSVVIVGQADGGSLAHAGRLDNWPGEPGVSGRQLAAKLWHHLETVSSVIAIGNRHVSRLVVNADGTYQVEAPPLAYRAITVLLASGQRPHRLGVPGENRLTGQGVSYCSACDGPFMTGRTALIAGSGAQAVQAVLLVARFAKAVYWLKAAADSWALPANQPGNITVLSGASITELVGERRLEAVRYRQAGVSKELFIDGLFVEAGNRPNSELAAGLAELNPAGYIITAENGATSCSGLFAAGDVTDSSVKYAAVAAGDGLRAATAIDAILHKEIPL